jgi:hypothetical protein
MIILATSHAVHFGNMVIILITVVVNILTTSCNDHSCLSGGGCDHAISIDKEVTPALRHERLATSYEDDLLTFPPKSIIFFRKPINMEL